MRQDITNMNEWKIFKEMQNIKKRTKVVEVSTQKIMWDGSIIIMEASVPEHIRLTSHREYEHVFSSLSHLPW